MSPASILHHLVLLPNSHESMKYLVDRSIELTLETTAGTAPGGWTRHALRDETMAQWLEKTGPSGCKGAK